MAEKRSYTKRKEDISAPFGKVPPQAVDVEEAVLGALMLERDAFISVGDILKPESFYDDRNRKIFIAIRDLCAKEKPVDLLMVTQELRNREELDEVGGPVYITQLTSKVASAAHIEYHARIIAQKYIQRELIKVSSEIQTKSYDDTIDVDDLLNEAESSIFGIAEGNIKKETVRIKPVLKEAILAMEEAALKPEGMSGVPSGFTGLDRITSGWQNSDLVIIAARPAMGKTAFVLSMARNMAVDHNVAVGVFSLEMSSLQLVNRLIASESELGSEKIKNGKLEKWEWEVLHNKIKNLDDAPIFIDDTPALSIFEFRAKCRRLKMQHNVGIIIVDYLQLMTAGGDNRGNREQEVSMISRTLKAIAKEINVPILALSQLSRAVESREGKKPQLSDLRESGAIEQDADMVLFIHRPEYYKITEDEQGNSLIGLGEIIIAKHRNGSVGEVFLRFRKELARFCDLEDTHDQFADLGDGTQGVTLSSKMNEDEGRDPIPQFGAMPPNAGFDDEPPF